jgi:protein SCO1
MRPQDPGRAGSYDPQSARFRRRHFVHLVGTGVLLSALLHSREALAAHGTDVTGALPALSFTMTRASDGKLVTASDYKGKIVLLYFGYTFCPDVCPTTLLNLSLMLKKLGPLADRVRILFVTVDPQQDTLAVLKQYTGAFAPQTVGLRGTPDQLAELAKRYRVAYSAEPATKDHPYSVTHSSAVYVFNRAGDIKLLFSGLATSQPDVDAYTDDLRAMANGTDHPGLFSRLIHMLL